MREDPPLHASFRSRLRKRGAPVPGSQARWYERFRMPWEEGSDSRRLQDVAALVRARQDESIPADEPTLEAWDSFAAREWNLNDEGLAIAQARQRALERRACTDGDLAFGGALVRALGVESEACSTFVPSFAAANELTPANFCRVRVADVAEGLASANIAWSPPPRVAILAQVCVATCGAFGVGDCAK